MISIITSVHNQLGMNKLFYETLVKNTVSKFELIVIDNNSTDGTKEFYKQNADIVIENDKNYSYPYCQNQGMKRATYENLAFFNNDILVSYHWDKHTLKMMEQQNIEVISFATNDHLENKSIQKKINNKWKRVKYPMVTLFGTGYRNLKLMAKLTYGNFAKFCEKRFHQFTYETKEGFSGSCILLKKSAIDKIGAWDEKIQGADFDLFCRTKLRSLEVGDIKPIQLALGIYFHHYQRLTLKSQYEPFADKNNLISFDQKWGATGKKLLKDIV